MLASISSLGICHAQEAPVPNKREEGPKARILCVQTLTKADEEAILAVKNEAGEFREYGKIELRTAFIGDWVPVQKGVTHVVRRKGEGFASLCSFTIAEASKRVILIMLPDTKTNTYRIQVIDVGKLRFQKGKALIVNYGGVPAAVVMGNKNITVAPGKQVVQAIDANEDGMYRMLIGHVDKDRNIVACYDRYVSSNPNTRKIVLLFPDPDTGLRAMSLSEFGPFD
ncbi:hypothetical protein HZ994_18740 [Akkermansiaceae bacterium]|nr:hypothetical protein HZ994_18740 [Akkermansiaceae bacterium]